MVVLFGAELIYALYGFGSGLLAVSLLALVFPDLAPLVVLLLLVNLPTELFVVLRDRKAVALRQAGPLMAAMVLGTVAGAWLLKIGAGDRRLVFALGIVVVAFSAWFLWEALRGRAQLRRLPWLAAPLAGLTGGLLGGLFGTGGPPVILYFQLSGLPKQAFRATLLCVFLTMSLLRLPLYAAGGLIDGAMLLSAALILPPGLAGLWLGQRLHTNIPEKRFRLGVALVLGLLGLLLMLRA